MKRMWTFLLLITLLLSLTTINPLQAQPLDPADWPVLVDLAVPMPPTPVKANGKAHLFYELNITNLSDEPLRLTRLEVLADETGAVPIATFQDAELTGQLLRYGNLADLPDERLIGGGMRAVVFLHLTLEPASVADGLRHRLFFQSGKSNSMESERIAEGEWLPLPATAPIVIAPPLRGAGWLAVNGASNSSIHRRSLNVINSKARIAQRFAIDWVQINRNGQLFHDDPAQNANWYGYGAELLAVADGVVVDVKDGIPENIPLSGTFAVPITPETVGGNYVTLDLGAGHFAFYGHLQPQSLRVKLGDKVRRGQVLGLLGNSGNSDAPHLHFHIADVNSPLGAEGLPYVFKTFERQGLVESLDVFETSAGWQPQGKAEKHQLEMPLENEVIRFS